MLYSDGVEAKLGDRVRFSNGDTGTIVFSIDTDEYSEGFPKKEWEYLNKGIMVKTDAGALIHYEDPNVEEIFLVERKKQT